MKTFLKYLLITLLWLVVLGLCVAGAVLSGLDVEDGLIIFAVIFVVWYAFKLVVYLVRRLLAYRKVQKLINIENPESANTGIGLFNAFRRRDIDKHLARVLKVIARLRMSASEDGSDQVKIALNVKLSGAHSNWVTSPTAERPQVSEPVLSEHPGLKWHLLNRFALLDVDSRLINGASTSRSEWYELLDGLAFVRPACAIDALVVTLDRSELEVEEARLHAADRLREIHGDILEHCAIDVPISIVLTGVSELASISDWADDLDQSFTKKAFGQVNRSGNEASELVGEVFSELEGLFKNNALNTIVTQGFSVDVISSVAGTSALHSHLSGLLTRLFVSNNFTASPDFAGLFFVTEQESKPIFADGLLEAGTLLWRTPRPLDVRTDASRKKAKMRLAYHSACAVLAALVFILYLSAYRTVDIAGTNLKINAANEDGIGGTVRNLQARLLYMETLSDLSIAHWLPLSNDPLQLKVAQSRFLTALDNEVIANLDSALDEVLTEIDSVAVGRIELLVRRINLIDAALQGASVSSMELLPQIYEEGTLEVLTDELTPLLNDLYLKQFELGRELDRSAAYARWDAKKKAYQRELSRLVVASNGNLEWISDWVRSVEQPTNITLKSYWGGNIDAVGLYEVDGLYTLEGKALVDEFIASISAAVGVNTDYFDRYLPAYQAEYERNYLASWKTFLSRFGEGQDTLGNRADWLQVINNLSTARNIYFNVLNDADFQLQQFYGGDEQPEWLEFLDYYQDMLALGADQLQSNSGRNNVLTKLGLKLLSKTGAVGAAVAKSAKSGLKTQKKLDKASGDGPGPDERALNLQAAADELDYFKAQIANVSAAIEQKSSSYSNTVGLFNNPDNPTGAGTSLAELQKSVSALEGLIGRPSAATESFWNVYTGAVELMQSFMLNETACVINDRWEKEYLFDIYGIPDYKLSEVAFSTAGTLWSFVDTELSAFLDPKPGAGYTTKRIDDEFVAFKPELFEYLYKARDMQQEIVIDAVTLTLDTKPTDLNRRALLLVANTQVAMQCEGGVQTLGNINIVDTGTLNWDPSCQAMSVSFEIGNRIVEKQYSGYDGIRQFLADFEQGQHSYQIEEFPELFYILKQFQIDEITANISVGGAARLTQALDNRPPTAMSEIAACWN